MPVIRELLTFGYVDSITYQNSQLCIGDKEVKLNSDSLFFVDAGFRVADMYVFALSSPINEIKGLVTLNLEAYQALMATSYADKFNINIEQNPTKVVIVRQYGMRKILKLEFDPNRYILRKGFPDFPACPYGHTFKMLGYDTQEKMYVRLTSSILKDARLEIITYKE